jgi:hypothetical protein
MTHRLLRRRCIIREYDFDRVRTEALALVGGDSLYDRVSFEPISRDSLEKSKLWLMLKGDSKWPMYHPMKYPMHTLEMLKDYVYNKQYLKWTCTWDDQGQMWVQSRVNTPRTRLGWGIFEKDLNIND